MKKSTILIFLILSISCGNTNSQVDKEESKTNKMPKTKENILKELDKVINDLSKIYSGKEPTSEIKYNFFLDLEHGYVETAGSKIHLFGDKENWAIVFEKIGYSNRGTEIQSELNFIGNCINYKKENYGYGDELTNTEYITLIDGNELERIQIPETENEDFFEMVNPKIKSVKVRNEIIQIENDKTKYLKYHIKLVDKDNPRGNISFGNLARYLYATQSEKFCATQSEIKTMLPKDIPFILTIDKFHYQSAYDPKNIPSRQETYNLIADILVSLDRNLWKPKEKTNNEWYNWKSGHL